MNFALAVLLRLPLLELIAQCTAQVVNIVPDTMRNQLKNKPCNCRHQHYCGNRTSGM